MRILLDITPIPFPVFTIVVVGGRGGWYEFTIEMKQFWGFILCCILDNILNYFKEINFYYVYL